MIALLASPIARWAGVAVVIGLVALWGWSERAGRQVAVLERAAAVREAAGLRETIRQMGVRREAEDAARNDPDPAGSLRERWGRP